MSTDELTKLIDAAFRDVPYGHPAPVNIEPVITEIARWIIATRGESPQPGSREAGSGGDHQRHAATVWEAGCPG